MLDLPNVVAPQSVLISERLVRFAALISRENVLGDADCADLASKQLWR